MVDRQPLIRARVVIGVLAWALAIPELAEATDPPSRVVPLRGDGPASLRGRVEGVASPGSRIRLALERPARPGSRYSWVQTAGPALGVEGQITPELKLTVPSGADPLGFLLVIADDQGITTVPFAIPIVEVVRTSETSAGSPALLSGEIRPGPTADAGDDAIGLVGRRVTLNGSESLPRDGLGYRWIQVDGPQAVSLDEAGRFCSFVPEGPGLYRFALVVALENKISLADFVEVSVGTPPRPAPSRTPLSSSNGSVAPAMMPGLPASPIALASPLDAAVAQALASLDDAPVVAGPLADVFQAAALRMDLYRTYGEIFSEVSRRLDTVVPADPSRRARWNALLFEPLSSQTIAALLPTGLDLRVAGSQDAPLTTAQKQELRSLFERLARRLAPPRGPR